MTFPFTSGNTLYLYQHGPAFAQEHSNIHYLTRRVYHMTFIMHVIGLFVLIAASEMLNGIARTVFLNKRFGVQNAKRISLLPALAVCLLICYYYVPFLHIRTDGGLLVLGISLSLFMGLFDIMVARFIARARWDAILDDFNIWKGNLLGLGMAAMAFCPLLAARIGGF